MAADTGMDTCPSPETSDSRKRPLDGDSENGDVKRSHFSSASSDPAYHFKVLIPAMVAGAIIGKGGETIAQLQKDTGARVKMSKSHDFYPGTTERACLITGSVESIMVVLDFIMEKIKEKPELVKPLPELDAKMPQDRDKQVKILVPNSTAGMIIGKGGNYIKQIKEASGSYVQISQKAQDVTLPERCITVVGEKEGNKKACTMILAKVVDDPQSGSCPNVSYADVSGPVANFNPTGSPYARTNQVEQAAAAAAVAFGNVGSVLMNGGGGGAGSLAALNLTLSLSPPGTTSNTPITPLLEQIKVALRSSGYSESNIAEIGAALTLLGKYGALHGVSLGPLGAAGAPLSAATPLSAAAAYFPLAAAASAADTAAVFGPIGQVGLGMYDGGSVSERFAEVALEAAFRPSAVAPVQAYAPQLLGAALNKSPTPGDTLANVNGGARDTKNVEIAEVIVGAILGPGGRSLVEIQQLSGANIQISKKGTFAPGTRNRIVTITGTPGAITSAHYLIEQKIQEEELKRTRHSAISGIMQ